jgi:hypothetical protein
MVAAQTPMYVTSRAIALARASMANDPESARTRDTSVVTIMAIAGVR